MLDSQYPIATLLKLWEQERLIAAIDRHFALQMTQLHPDSTPVFALICALLSRQVSHQHTCLPIDKLVLSNPLSESVPKCRITASIDEIIDTLTQSKAVGLAPKSIDKPLILDGNNLYLQRYYQFEYQTGERLKRLSQPIVIEDIDRASNILDCLFPQVSNQHDGQKYDWQKIATATALGNKLAVITGGPGTGKTTTVTKLLFLLCQQESLNIRLVAPTGKAAVRLSESIKTSKQKLTKELSSSANTLSLAAIDNIPEQVSTLHRLLGVIPNHHQFRHHRHNQLRLDLLVIDEASMVDLPMMYKLLEALPEHARLILLGDQDQLASVEAGAVLADICAGIKATSPDNSHNERWIVRYSPQQAQQLGKLTGFDLSEFVCPKTQLGDSLTVLRHSHRFDKDAGIGVLAETVNRSDIATIENIWRQDYQELDWIRHQNDPQHKLELNALIEQAVTQYKHYLTAITKEGQTPSQIIARFNRYRILCAVRDGEFGVNGLNLNITNALAHAKLIDPQQEFYIGRPIIVQSNDYNLGLFNGDVGVILADEQSKNRSMAYFVQPDGELLKVLPARLPIHESCYAMTVHKSQGSEFNRVALALPPKPSIAQRQLLTKELIYTAITRAKTHFSLLSSRRVFELACQQTTTRASGLAKRLWL